MTRTRLLCVLATLWLLAGCSEDSTAPEEALGPPGRLYVANQTDSTIYVYDTETLERVDSFPSGIGQPHHIKFSDDLRYFYVIALQVPGELAKFDASTNTLLDVLTLPGVNPTALAITPDGVWGYVCDYSGPTEVARLHKVNLETMTLQDSVSAAGASTHYVDITSDGSLVVATNMSDVIAMVYTDADTVHPVNIDPDSTYALWRRKYGPYGVTIDHKDSLAYIACLHHHEVAAQIRVLDLAAQTIVDSIYLPINFDHTGDPAGPTLVELSPDDAYLYVTTQYDNSIIVVRLGTRTVLEYPVSIRKTYGVTCTNDGSRVYVSAAGQPPATGKVYILDGKTNTMLDSLDVGRGPFAVRWRPL